MVSPLHIATVMPFFYPATHMGGPVAQAYELGKRMTARKHAVSVVTTDIGIASSTPRNEWIEVDGMRVWYGATRPWHRVVPYWEPQLRRALEEVVATADVVHVRMGLTLLNDQVRRLCRRQGNPYIYTAEGALCPKRLKLKSLRKAVFLRLVERRVLSHATVLHSLTPIERRDFIAQGADAERIEIIPNGVELHQHSQGEGKLFRQRWQIADGAQVVLYFGRVTRLKGIEPLLRGFARYAKTREKAVLVIAGHGDGEENRLAQVASELGISTRVKMPGAVQGADRWQALGAADAFALTSFSEGLPIAVLEAMSMGLPVIISPDCNLPEVADAHAGEIVAPAPEAVEAALCQILDDADVHTTLSANARHLVAERYDIEKIVDQFEALYQRLARRDGRRLAASST